MVFALKVKSIFSPLRLPLKNKPLLFKVTLPIDNTCLLFSSLLNLSSFIVQIDPSNDNLKSSFKISFRTDLRCHLNHSSMSFGILLH